jgi:hypothetical protein
MKDVLWWGAVLLLAVGGVMIRPQAVHGDPARGWYLNGGLGLNWLD